MVAEITVNNKQIKSIVSKLEKTKKSVTSRRIMNAILLKVKNNILLRTNAGKDINFRPFESYNAAYAREEGKTVVNLTKSGKMLNSMTQKVLSGTKGKIFFINSGYPGSNVTVHDLVRIHNTGEGNMPEREFFGVNNMDDKLALNEYQKAIRNAIKKVGL